MAPVAIQQGIAAAENIRRSIQGEPTRAFRYVNRGGVATIGRGSAVADFGRVHISGLPAWLAWLFIHIFYLTGFDNKVLVILQWAWSYLTYQRGARLITTAWRFSNRGSV